MIIFGIQKNKNFKLSLPEIIDGDYILRDDFGEQICNIKSMEGKWVVYPTNNFTLHSTAQEVESLVIEEYNQFYLRNKISGSTILLFTYPTYEQNVTEYKLKKSEITIGSGGSCDVCFSSPHVAANFAKITYQNEKWYFECADNCYAFIDGRLAKRKKIKSGEIIFIFGLKIICINDFIVFINCVRTIPLKLNQGSFAPREPIVQQVKEDSFKIESEEEALNKNEEFFRSPRFRTQVEVERIKVKIPPQKAADQQHPAILTIGPQLTMMISSVVNMMTTLSSAISSDASLGKILPSLIVTSITLVSSLLWPSLTRKYAAREKRKTELKRVKNYRAYLDNMDKKITETIEKQKQILKENSISLEECQQIIFTKKRNLWERSIPDNDFLQVRLGVGYVKPYIDLECDTSEMEANDVLEDELNDLLHKYKYMENTPLNVSFVENRISAIIGNYGILQLFFENMLLQLMTFHVYNELKVVVFSNEMSVKNWEYLKFSPHCWDNNKQRRFIAATVDEKKQLSTYLEAVYKARVEALGDSDDGKPDKKTEDDKNDQYLGFDCYYLIIIDDIISTRNLEIVKTILKDKRNLGFSIIIKNDRISNLPSQCSTFFNITDQESGMFKNDLNQANQLKFKAELNKTVNVEACIKQLANIYVNVPRDAHELPKSVGFMEMYGVGNVNQFNSANRWIVNNPVTSLSVPVGIDQQGEIFNFDIHEKAYGPHGLVAGTTGSGKSEWIITYILSLCVNFSPLEVQFVLIDYKGGGLAGSFVNEETGMRLPHLVGTITNLDKSEIRRSLASLEAESKRRQRMFNEAREKLNDSSMNIYKYQQYYRQGMLDEPLSHLFLISDEFAELKAQEPEFLDQLVSIARIGRSLGIHLILATQKPAGVVDDQMWTNSRFKICLRVQDTSDSNDMIKCPDAAYLHQTGAFYLQVGLNEVFALGQSAYAGNKYKPTSVMKKNIDTSVDVLDRIGNSVDNVDYIEPDNYDESQVHGEELLNIILYVSDLAKQQNLVARRLWLDAIPENIYVDNLKKQYGFTRNPYHITAIVGQYDDPYRQYQGLLTLDLNCKNAFIIGQTGSGKEQMLQSIIYSIMTNYLPQEACIYICDFGAETLAMFDKSPHVGDIVYSKNKTKIFNIFKYLKKILRERRNKYRDFGGNYESYNKAQTENKEPLIITVINNVSFIKEEYYEQYEELESLIVEGSKYGIVFLEADNDLGVHKNKVMETFDTRLSLKINDFTTFLGSKVRGINPKELKGRGLIVMDDEGYEFQTAKICDEATMQKTVRFVCEKFYESYKFKNPPIPLIPNPINIDQIDLNDISINKVCVGYSTVNIEPVYFDLRKNVATLFIGSKKAQLKSYFKVFNRQLEVVAEKGTKVYLFDPEDIFKPEGYNKLTYVPSTEVVNTFNNLLIYINNEYEKYNSLENKNEYQAPSRSLLVLYSTSIIYSRIGYDKVMLLTEAFDHALELKLFDFIIADNTNDFRDCARDSSITHLFVESNGVAISTAVDNQMTIDIGSKDFKQKDQMTDKQGYAVTIGKGKFIQVLQNESDDDDEEEE